jgi:hypothetical protein
MDQGASFPVSSPSVRDLNRTGEEPDFTLDCSEGPELPGDPPRNP